MQAVTNLDKKRICDISEDGKTVYIIRRGCITKITCAANGKLLITHQRSQEPSSTDTKI